MASVTPLMYASTMLLASDILMLSALAAGVDEFLINMRG